MIIVQKDARENYWNRVVVERVFRISRWGHQST